MRCPYCNGEMEQGYVQGTGYYCRLGWYPSEAGPAAHLFFAGEKISGTPAVFDTARLEGYRCRRCRKIIIDC